MIAGLGSYMGSSQLCGQMMLCLLRLAPLAPLVCLKLSFQLPGKPIPVAFLIGKDSV